MRIGLGREGTWRDRARNGVGALTVAALVLGLASCNQEAPTAADEPAAPAAASGTALVEVENLEPVTTEYIVANPTNVYNNHFVYDTTVVGEVDRGTTVEVLGKVPGYEWLLIGRNGEPWGYVPISMLSPADLYIP
jgi:hypothetical protein